MSIRRHYKKDSRYVNDLYTLTYDNHESLDTISLITSLHATINNEQLNGDDDDDDGDDDDDVSVTLKGSRSLLK